MKNAPCIVAAAVLAAACAAPQASTRTAAASSPVYYCAKDHLIEQGNRLECNWQPSADEACKFMESSTLERASLASDPQSAGRCNTGVWLVKVSRR